MTYDLDFYKQVFLASLQCTGATFPVTLLTHTVFSPLFRLKQQLTPHTFHKPFDSLGSFFQQKDFYLSTTRNAEEEIRNELRFRA